MARTSYLFTSESVSEGHPDKVCDRISDEVVDLFFREGHAAGIDPYQIRVACETLATTNRVVIAGEVRGPRIQEDTIVHLVRQAIRDIGYEQEGFHWERANIEVLLHAQSADIAQGVDPEILRHTCVTVSRAAQVLMDHASAIIHGSHHTMDQEEIDRMLGK